MAEDEQVLDNSGYEAKHGEEQRSFNHDDWCDQQNPRLHYDLFAESNNYQHYEHFIIALKKKSEGMKTLVILDNLRIHHATKVQYLFDKDFHQLFLPPYSSQLNPIETLWSLIKRKWVRDLQLYADELSQVREMRSGEALVKSTIQKLHETIGKDIKSLKKSF